LALLHWWKVTALISKTDAVPIRSDEHVARVRQVVRQFAVELNFSIVDQTKIVTAASELARNIMVHGGGEGAAQVEQLEENGRKGLRIHFVDTGPGIPDISRALQDGYTTASGLGLGLGGAKRLVNDFEIESEPGKGTRVSITRWK
jgi:serine/threonine-protein kinase RsbT